MERTAGRAHVVLFGARVEIGKEIRVAFFIALKGAIKWFLWKWLNVVFA